MDFVHDFLIELFGRQLRTEARQRAVIRNHIFHVPTAKSGETDAVFHELFGSNIREVEPNRDQLHFQSNHGMIGLLASLFFAGLIVVDQ
ncbi:MAG: hypothetical protein OXE77_04905 [Flavobacteriaceae bacterium]|nr:hypothetical protein [Flavobacteriaceae bacterium]